jgi:hypothetical protein
MSSTASAADDGAAAGVPASLLAATFAKLHPKEYHRKFMQHAVRSGEHTQKTHGALMLLAHIVIVLTRLLLLSARISRCMQAGWPLAARGPPDTCRTRSEDMRAAETSRIDGELDAHSHTLRCCSLRFDSFLLRLLASQDRRDLRRLRDQAGDWKTV